MQDAATYHNFAITFHQLRLDPEQKWTQFNLESILHVVIMQDRFMIKRRRTEKLDAVGSYTSC
jgi:hypothetical protein